MSEKQKMEDCAYYLTMFKLKGHSTWRLHMGGRKDDFDLKEKANWPKGNAPEITERNVLRFDRLTGTFREKK